MRLCIRLGCHLPAWKTAKGVKLYKQNKIDYTVIKSYRVIRLLNCLGKVYEKVVADMLANWFQVHTILHEGQMRS